MEFLTRSSAACCGCECRCKSAARHPAGCGAVAVDRTLGLPAPYRQGYQTELHRLRGELLLELDGLAGANEALVCFQLALQLGRERGALGWELRAAMSVVRLRALQGEANAAEMAEARQTLRSLYTRYTEGFSTPDLQEAAALLS